MGQAPLLSDFELQRNRIGRIAKNFQAIYEVVVPKSGHTLVYVAVIPFVSFFPMLYIWIFNGNRRYLGTISNTV